MNMKYDHQTSYQGVFSKRKEPFDTSPIIYHSKQKILNKWRM